MGWKTGPHTWREGKEKLKKEASGRFNKQGTYMGSLSWVAARWIDLRTACQNLKRLYRALNRVSHIHRPDGLNNTLSRINLGTVPSTGMVGGEYIPRTGKGTRYLQLSGSGLWPTTVMSSWYLLHQALTKFVGACSTTTGD